MLGREARDEPPALTGALSGFFPPDGSWTGTIVRPCGCVSSFPDVPRDPESYYIRGQVSVLPGKGRDPHQRGLLLKR